MKRSFTVACFALLLVAGIAFAQGDEKKAASTKPAKLENGVTINVPEFVGTGDKVKVNPTTGEYQERAK